MRWAKKVVNSREKKREVSIKSQQVFFSKLHRTSRRESKTWWGKRRDFPLFRVIDRRIQCRWCCRNFFVSNIELLFLDFFYIHRINLPLLWSAKCFSFLFFSTSRRYWMKHKWAQNREGKNLWGNAESNFYDVMFGWE